MEKTRTQASVETGVKILRKAIKNNISLSKASKESKKGRNYVSDIKARITENYKKKNVSKETYNEFRTLAKEYSNLNK